MRGWSYLGCWHSHPVGTKSSPSAADLLDWALAAVSVFEQSSLPYLTNIIVTGRQIRCWTVDRNLTFREVNL